MCSFLKLLSEFQTLVVGIIGFAGIIITIYKTSKINRDQRKREILHEQNSIRNALITELESIRVTFEDRSESEENGQDWLIPKNVSTVIYEVLLPRIGLLSGIEIKRAMKAYLLVNETPIRLSLISGITMEGVPEGYMHIEKEYVKTARGIHQTFLNEINKAIEILTVNLNNNSEE